MGGVNQRVWARSDGAGNNFDARDVLPREGDAEGEIIDQIENSNFTIFFSFLKFNEFYDFFFG